MSQQEINDLAQVTLLDRPDVNVDASAAELCDITLADDRNIAAPTNPREGHRLVYRITQDAVGGHVVTWDAVFRFSTSVVSPTLSTAAGATDYVMFIYNAAAATWDCMGANLGF